MNKQISHFLLSIVGLALAACAATQEAAPPAARPGEYPQAYVFNMGSRDVTVIDTGTHEVVRTVAIEGAKKFGWVDGTNYFDGQILWVGNLDPDSGQAEILLLDLESLEVVKRIPLGAEESNVFVSRASHDGRHVFASLLGSGEVVVLDASSHKQVRRIPANQIACDVDLGTTPDGFERAFVPNREADSVQAIDVSSLEVVQTVDSPQGSWPWMLTLSPDGGHLWVQEAKGNTNTVLDSDTLETLSRVPTGKNPSMAAFTPDGSQVYAGHLEDTVLAVIDARSYELLERIEVGANPVIIEFRPDGRYAYVTVRKENLVAVIDTGSRQVVARIPTGETPLGLFIPRP